MKRRCKIIGAVLVSVILLLIVIAIVLPLISMNEDPSVFHGEVLNWIWNITGTTMNGDPIYEFTPSFKNGSNLFFDDFLNQIE